MAYGAAPQSDASDAVRVLVGDVGTSTSLTWLDDAEYDYFISVTSNHYSAARLASNSLAALFMGAAASGVGSNGYLRKKVGDLELEKADAFRMAEGFRQLSREYALRSAQSITPFAGGQSKAGKYAQESDTDRVVPAFTRGLMDRPGVSLTNASTYTSSL